MPGLATNVRRPHSTSSGLPAATRSAAANATLELPFRVPPQEWFTLRQAGAVLGLSESTAEKLYDRGELTGHSHNAGRGERDHKRVLRAAVIAYAIRTADYEDASFDQLLLDSLRHLSAPRLLALADALRRMAALR